MRILAVMVSIVVTAALVVGLYAAAGYVVTPGNLLRWTAACRPYSPIVPAFFALSLAPVFYIVARRRKRAA